MIWKDKFPKENRYFENENGILYNSDVMNTLKQIPNESIDCVVTSPPYWALRDYGVDGQLGLEPTFQEYLEKLWAVFDEVYRILKPTGTCWVNLGDTYAGSGKGVGHSVNQKEVWKFDKKPKIKEKIPAKSLCQIPSRFAIGMVDRGWILRNEIIWHKPNCMPQSVKDRFTVDFEKIFFFVKQRKYYFEQQFEPHKTHFEQYEKARRRYQEQQNAQFQKLQQGGKKTVFSNPQNPQGRNKRTVWSISTKPFKDAHFAVFPPEIPENCIKAGCPDIICKKCGKPREKRYIIIPIKRTTKGNGETAHGSFGKSKITNYYINCDCNAGWESGIVLDPLMGSGTTAVVAEKLNRRWIGIELNKEYCEIAKHRILASKN